MPQIFGLVRLDPRVEQERSGTSSRIREAELLEHGVALRPVLDQRILLSEGTQVDALAEVVHVLEALAPAGVDDLQDDEALDVARNVRGPTELLLFAIELERLVAEIVEAAPRG